MRLSFHLEILIGDRKRRETAAGTVGFAEGRARLSSAAPRVDLSQSGCIVGPLFKREPLSPRVTELDRYEQRDIVRSGGAALLSRYWGGYVALLEKDDASITVLRDPSGMMPCYFRRGSEGVTLASDMTALAEPGSEEVDYGSLACMFAGIDMLGRRTGISNVEELLPGEQLTVSDAGIRVEQMWTPWNHVEPRKGLDFESATHALRDALRQCIGAWSTCFDNILVGVSGGLDSSIVVAALGSRSPDVRCLTMVEPGTDGDERRYACALVEQLGQRLDASNYDLGSVDINRAVLPHLPLPIAGHYFPAIASEHKRISSNWPIGAYFAGNGGDNVFCAMRSAAPLADRFLAGGMPPGLFATARDIADLTGTGLAEVVRHGVARVRRWREGHRPRRDLRGLGPSGRAAVLSSTDQHPWLSAPAGSLPGKASHVAMLARAYRSIELYPRDVAPPQISPLLSQPIVELCLSIPTWYWVRGGRDRAVAREAVRDSLPTLIVERRTKGGPTGFVRRIFEAQRDDAIAMLSRGKLVAAGLLDPDWLGSAATNSWHSDGGDLRLLSFAAAESWVRWWEDGSDTRR
ncbi:asparagine synthase C-terminal domain-containing protein [Sphingopyxis indica]|uniref:asparagine synthase C-terminal domain-containing protein n=1 Tax=Sphingopyxis indica TaxID=436663 RepID=UPI0029394B3D|nr:asparagine synthase C-terminal domain-containing protein [Sphingopyxis indica]WOF44541.1 asparagine synthase C-terminal domain-containing protein [Sphingopyxis indica]